ncbi:MAG TPA: 3-hydroxyacyl-ACP dehydratase FabZ [Anaerovoracaceae bacterium]|nr:3-hydroxyacyl-ACP dehydratase FabZ [Anaerovoracaceae bacterium]
MNIDDLKKILPHRKPMLLLDEAEINEDGKAIGLYTVKGDEYFLQGHFPGNPVVPGVILCEMMAQTCGVLLSNETSGKTPYYTGLDRVKFRGMVKPGDTIEFRCEILKIKLPFVFAKGAGYVNGKLSVQGEFSFALID